MYLEIREDLEEKINSLTITNYEINNGRLKSENIVPLIEDLIAEIDVLNEKIDDLKEYKEQYCEKYSFN